MLALPGLGPQARAAIGKCAGNALQAQGRMDEVRAHLEQALAFTREFSDRKGEGRLLAGLGILQFEQGRLDDARDLYEQAVAAAREVGDQWREGIQLNCLGAIQDRRGALDAALSCFDAAELLLRDVGDPVELADLLCNRAKGLAKTRPDAARDALAEAEQLVLEVAAGPDSNVGKCIAEVRALLDPSGEV